MALNQRVQRLERWRGSVADGTACRVCRGGCTGLIVTFPGDDPNAERRPCAGCGRDEPYRIVCTLAEPPEAPAPAPIN